MDDRPTKAQRQILRLLADGDCVGDTAPDVRGNLDPLAYGRWLRTVEALRQRGWCGEDDITDAGRSALTAPE